MSMIGSLDDNQYKMVRHFFKKILPIDVLLFIVLIVDLFFITPVVSSFTVHTRSGVPNNYDPFSEMLCVLLTTNMQFLSLVILLFCPFFIIGSFILFFGDLFLTPRGHIVKNEERDEMVTPRRTIIKNEEYDEMELSGRWDKLAFGIADKVKSKQQLIIEKSNERDFKYIDKSYEYFKKHGLKLDRIASYSLGFKNCNVFSRWKQKLWWGDINKEKDFPKLQKVANELQIELYLLHEDDGRWDNAYNPDLSKTLAIIKPETKDD